MENDSRPPSKRKRKRRALRPGSGAHRPAGMPQPRDPGLPPWLPDGSTLDIIPAELRDAVVQLVNPAYQQFVVEASDALERMIGFSLVHLLWLEILEQFEMRREYQDVTAVLGLAAGTEGAINDHLRLIDAKLRAGSFLVRLRELRHRWGGSTHSLLAALGPSEIPAIPPPETPHNPPDGDPEVGKTASC